jgi:neutral ceramidase
MGNLYYGYSDSLITPGRDMSLGGYGNRNYSGFGNSGVLDELYARALSLKYKEDELILVTLDLCVMTTLQSDVIRNEISQSLGIPKSNIMISCSHTHSGPVLSLSEYALRAISYDIEKIEQIESQIETYFSMLKRTIVRICNIAHIQKLPGKAYSSTFKGVLGYNRRYLEKNDQGEIKASSLFNLWKNPKKRPNGIIDDEIPILMIEQEKTNSEDNYLNPSGNNRIILFSVPYHAVVMSSNNWWVSADYPGTAKKCLEEIFGQGTKAMFLAGACGDTHPMISTQDNTNAVKIIGNAIGYGVAVALAQRENVFVNELKAAEYVYIDENYAVPDNNNEDYAKLLEVFKKRGVAKDKMICYMPHDGRVITQIFKIGEAAIIGVSAECFTKLGMELRNRLPYKQTLISTVTNGNVSYLPVPEAFEQGAYEVITATTLQHFDKMTLMNIIEVLVEKGTELY